MEIGIQNSYIVHVTIARFMNDKITIDLMQKNYDALSHEFKNFRVVQQMLKDCNFC